jgi:nucleotide-binding universal stress UspA family protein
MSDDTRGHETVRFGHVLVPLDGSAFAAAAVPTAQVLAERFDAQLAAIAVATSQDEASELRTAASEALGEASDVVHLVVGEEPAAEIRRRANELGDCLVCMSTHGRGRITGAVIGSVARAVVQSSDEPIVVVGPQADRPPMLVRSGQGYRRPMLWPPPLSQGGIVACVDGTPASEAVLPVAADWAASLAMSLTIITVVPEQPPPVRQGDPEQPAPLFSCPPDPHDYVTRLAVDFGGEPRVVRDPIGVGSGVRAELNERPAALVALSTHPPSGWERIRVGATAADIVRAIGIPALITPAPLSPTDAEN